MGVRVRGRLDAGRIRFVIVPVVVVPVSDAENDRAQQHARRKEEELSEAVALRAAVPENLGEAARGA